jgi:hypothetical protein
MMDVWVAIGLVLSVAGIVLGVYYGQRSLAPRSSRGPKVIVRVANTFPVYDLPDGSQRIGDHHVSVSAVNTGDQPVAITSWGIKLPGDRRMVVTRPLPWATRLPHELRPGAPPAELPMPAEDIRNVARKNAISYDDMWPYVALADGTEVLAGTSVPLSEDS